MSRVRTNPYCTPAVTAPTLGRGTVCAHLALACAARELARSSRSFTRRRVSLSFASSLPSSLPRLPRPSLRSSLRSSFLRAPCAGRPSNCRKVALKRATPRVASTCASSGGIVALPKGALDCQRPFDSRYFRLRENPDLEARCSTAVPSSSAAPGWSNVAGLARKRKHPEARPGVQW